MTFVEKLQLVRKQLLLSQEAIAKELLDKETIEAKEFDEIMERVRNNA